MKFFAVLVLKTLTAVAHAATETALRFRALQGDYQAQRNLAYGYATGERNIGIDPVQACAWYLLILRSDSPRI